MLGVSGLMGTSGDGESGGASGGSSEVGASSSVPAVEGGGNRWPRQETLALLRIRSDMDVAFRDSSLKGPLWEEVSRKMAELGFQRGAKKCKEKFENVYKYHKRTKDGRASKSDGKTYRFFDQLEALDNTPPPSFNPPPPHPAAMPAPCSNLPTVSSTSPDPLSVVLPIQSSMPIGSSPFQPPPLQPPLPPPAAISILKTHTFQRSGSTSSSSTSSDEDIQMRRGKKRKWKEFFHMLMKDVIHKQEELQKKFLDTLEKRERDRMAREEAWRNQEMARMNREHDLLVQERSIAAAKDAAVIAFLQKVTDQNDLQIPISNTAPPPPPPPMQPQSQENNPPPKRQAIIPTPTPTPQAPQQQLLTLQSPTPQPPAAAALQLVVSQKADNGGGGRDNSISASSSRWPKAEVQALINLRTSLDTKYQENGPKGPLWEEISAAMGKLGYSRSSKRCKEKWENINKYFKKVKESNKRRPDDSKTCPYFHQLEAIYKERSKNDAAPPFNQPYPINPDTQMAPIMAQPEQQWPLPDPTARNQDHENESDHDEDVDDEDEEDEGGGFEIVTNKPPSSTAANAAE